MLEVKRIINIYGKNYKWGEINSIFMSDPFGQYFTEEASRSDMKEIKSYATDE